MFRVDINLPPLAAAYRGAAEDFPLALQRGLRRVATLVHRAADRNLSGGSAAWSYPAPRRSGDLARGMASQASPIAAVIENRAAHAWAVHTGLHPRWPSPPARPRPFLTDAAAAVDHMAELATAVAEVAPP